MDTVTTTRPAPPSPRAPTFRSYLAGSPRAAVAWGAAGVVAVAAALRAVAASRGWFFYDDMGWQGLAAAHARPDLELLTTAWNSHLQPLPWVVIWAQTHLAPLTFWPVVVGTALLEALYGWALFLALRRLFGSRPEILLLLTLGVLSSLTVSASVWWGVQLIQLPLLTCAALVVWAHLGYLQRRQWRDVALTAGLLLLGLSVSERVLLVLPLLVALTAGWFGGWDGSPGQAWRALWGARAAWAVLGVVGAAYVAFYLATAPSAASSGGDLALLLGVSWQAVAHSVVPALVGGPWTWLPVDEAVSIANPGWLACTVSAALVTGLLVWSCATRRHAARGWLLLLGFVLLGAVLLTATRAPLVGVLSAGEYRYFTELALVAPLALGLATLPVRWTAAGLETLALSRRSVPVAVTQAAVPWRPLGAVLRRHAFAVVALGCAAFVASSSVSLKGYDANWSGNRARPYIETGRAELAAYPDARLLDVPVPPEVVPPLANWYTRTAVVFRPVAGPERFLTRGAAGDELRVLDARGRMAQVGVDGLHAPAGPVAGCGWLGRGGPLTVPLEARTFPGSWLVRLSYFTPADAPATLRAGRTSSPVLLRQGLHAVYLMAEGEVGDVTLSGLPEGASVCVTGVEVGTPVAVAGS